MAEETSLDEILAACQNGVVAINELSQQITAIVSLISVSTASGSNTVALINAPRAMLSVTTSSGGIYYLPLY